ncbi:hypothetical protein CEE69_15985 [Rhodopirellula bahusiensis]|uniref:Uncharacterized protein n=1 Tax=Rhodopirellula bahusiensis TaxID=2014065 RepID=A0A2G1W638_9BACT|nr:hypothetical protein CEE69_15985 [Rhodopirellula bahusiensis]
MIIRPKKSTSVECHSALLVSMMVLGLTWGCSIPNKGDGQVGGGGENFEGLVENHKAAVLEAVEEPRVQNPPAKTIRFDGRETVLGTAEVAPVSTAQFCSELQAFLDQQKLFSASRFVDAHVDVAEQAFWERCVDDSSAELISFISEQLSQGVPPAISLSRLQLTFKTEEAQAIAYHQSRTDFIAQLQSGNPSEEAAQQLRNIAQSLDHPLVMLDALRLLGLRELVNERFGWAESLLLQAAQIAEEHEDNERANRIWLMVAKTCLHSERQADAMNAWGKATQGRVNLHLEGSRRFDSQFWIRAIEQRPSETKWPSALPRAFAKFGRTTGCELSATSSPELVLWGAVGSAHYERLEFQAALLGFKKAESFATGDDVMWLRILQSKCLASLGQTAAAAALLSGPAASENVSVAIAAKAAMGSVKLQSGAFQQGIQILSSALNDSGETQWNGRSHAEADYSRIIHQACELVVFCWWRGREHCCPSFWR